MMNGTAAVCMTLAIMLLGGCASAPVITPFKPHAIDSYGNVQVKEDLAVAVYPILDTEVSTKHFGSDLPSINIIPVFVTVENRRRSSNVTLLKDRVTLH